MTQEVTTRRICWPNPDATCLEGGCRYCNGHNYRAVADIEAYAREAGTVGNRGQGEKDALVAYLWGLESGWPDVDVR